MRCMDARRPRRSRRFGRLAVGVLAIAVSVVAGSVVAAVPTGATSPAWSIVPSSNPSGSTGAQLYGVACPSTTSCFAVGYSAGAQGTGLKSLVEHWRSTGWSIMASANPSGAIQTILHAVSCPSTTSCFAVGTYYTASTADRTVVEHWNGTRWSIMASPNPPGTENTILQGVSCPSTQSCFAVGGQGSDRTVAEHWNGSRWSMMAIANPSGSTSNGLYAVSCPTTISCFAVGSYAFGETAGLVEHWNGTRWGIMTSPRRSNATGLTLYGVSCSSTSNCFAVGYFSVAGGAFRTHVQHWDGTRWGNPTSPNYPGSYNTTLFGVACPGARSCFAVGAYFVASPAAASSIVEHWNGTSWTTMTSPHRLANQYLSGASCPSTTTCFAVGDYLTQVNRTIVSKTLAERYA